MIIDFVPIQIGFKIPLFHLNFKYVCFLIHIFHVVTYIDYIAQRKKPIGNEFLTSILRMSSVFFNTKCALVESINASSEINFEKKKLICELHIQFKRNLIKFEVG